MRLSASSRDDDYLEAKCDVARSPSPAGAPRRRCPGACVRSACVFEPTLGSSRCAHGIRNAPGVARSCEMFYMRRAKAWLCRTLLVFLPLSVAHHVRLFFPPLRAHGRWRSLSYEIRCTIEGFYWHFHTSMHAHAPTSRDACNAHARMHTCMQYIHAKWRLADCAAIATPTAACERMVA